MTTRRNFLILASAATAKMATGGLAGLIGGCATTKSASYDSFINALENPLIEQLGENEHIVPDDVMIAYALTLDKDFPMAGFHPGVAIDANYFTAARRDEFVGRLRDLDLKPKEINFYYNLFATPGTIIMSEHSLEDGTFEWMLPHERFHIELDKLPQEDYDYMIDVANYFIERDRPCSDIVQRISGMENCPFIEARASSGYNGINLHYAASRQPEEFYTYMAQGVMTDEIENALREEHPRAYELFDKIREDCKLK